MKTRKIVTTVVASIAFTLTALAQTLPSYVSTNGLVGYWGFNGNANDESGNGNNGTVNGATLTTDRNGNANSAYSFDGNDLISILNSPSFNFGTTNNFTMSMWFKRQSTSNGWDVLLSYACPDGGGGGGLQLGTTTNFHLEFGSSVAEFFDGGNVNDTSWHMLTATFDRVIDIVKIYQDGQFISNINVPNTYTYTPTCNSNILIGGERNYWPQYYFNGQIDDIAIYNRALTQEEITQLYTATPAPTASAQTFCNGATVESLVATGTDLKWYTTETGGAPLASTTPLTIGTYYVSQTLDGSESLRTAVPVSQTPAMSSIVVANLTPIPAPTEVAIGTQTWKTTNLDVATYSDGTVIPQVTDPTQWGNLTTGAWCYYNNDSANGTTYGKLYNWYAVAGIHDTDPNTPNKTLAPSGYHVPSDAEWTTLTTYLDAQLPAGNAGGKMKATGTSLWVSPNSYAINSSGFTGLPGGGRTSGGTFYAIGGYGYWWSSSEENFDTTFAWSRLLIYANGSASRSGNYKERGFSVRCLRD